MSIGLAGRIAIDEFQLYADYATTGFSKLVFDGRPNAHDGTNN